MGIFNGNKKSDREDVYHSLARHLDDLPAGFPVTDSGVEIRILKHLFTPEEAALALHLTLIPEQANVVAYRAGAPVQTVTDLLDKMAGKGLIYDIRREDQPALYMANQMVIGIWEYHVKDLDKQLIEDMNDYIPSLLHEAWKLPQLRTIPVERSISPKMEVMTYEVAEQILNRHDNVAVAPCICRREKKMMGEGCDKPEEICIVFGSAADYYVRHGMGRKIDHQEAADLLRKADEAGLVLQPGNAQKASNICCCCGCCCGVLRTLKKQPRPVDMISSAFYALSDPQICNGCETCVDRCQMDAVLMDDGYARIDLSRCIGCGLCVTTCPTEAMSMIRKEPGLQTPVPRTNRDAYIRLAQLRGKLGWPKIVQLKIRSTVDRWLAPN